jgi:hypothetical protein
MKYLGILFFGLLLSIGCTYSQNMINPEGNVIRCSSYGWGFIGGPMAINIIPESCIDIREIR